MTPTDLPRARPRVLLDTNILISYLLVHRAESPIPRLVEAVVNGDYTLLLPQEVVDELATRVATKPYLVGRIAQEELGALLAALRRFAIVLPRIDRYPAVTRDPKDDFLLAYAVVGQADILVSGDGDLLALEGELGLRIVTPKVFSLLLDETRG